MKKIKEFTKNWNWKEYVLILEIVVFISIIPILTIKSYNKDKQIEKLNKEYIKKSEKVIFEQQKEIQKLKKDVVLHSIIADSSIAKANRLSKKQVILQVELSRIDSVVNEFSEVDIDRYWSKRK